MKKSFLMLLAACAVSVSTAFAQDKCKDACKAFGPEDGKLSTELSFNPFDQNGNTFELEALRVRYFITKKHALRLGLGFGLTKDNSEDSDEKGTKVKESESKAGRFSLDLGYEYHFLQRGRFDLFAGASLGITKQNYSYTESHYEPNPTQYNPDGKKWVTTEYTGRGQDANDRAYFGFNVNIFTGADFYVYKGLFIGAEFGMKVSTQKDSEYEMKVTDQPAVKSTDDNKKVNLKLYAMPSFRIGWTF